MIGEFGMWFVGLVVIWAWLAPEETGRWVAKAVRAYRKALDAKSE